MLSTELTHPEILNLLARCGHGDKIAIVDSNYPAQARRTRDVPLVSLNLTHGVPSTPMIVELIARSIPIEKCTIPRPLDEAASADIRPVHQDIRNAIESLHPEAEFEWVSPIDFYELTSKPNLAFMIVTGERSHYGSTELTVGYLPEL